MTTLEQLPVSAFKGLAFQFEDDLYDLACLLLKGHLADEKRTGNKGRTTVKGLAMVYARVWIYAGSEKVIDFIRSQDIPYSATIEPDESSFPEVSMESEDLST